MDDSPFPEVIEVTQLPPNPLFVQPIGVVIFYIQTVVVRQDAVQTATMVYIILFPRILAIVKGLMIGDRNDKAQLNVTILSSTSDVE